MSVLTAGRHCQVVGAGQSGDAIQQDHDILAALYEPLRSLERHLRNAGMILDRLVERGGDNLSVHRALHVGHFLGTLANQRDQQMNIIVIGSNTISDVLEQNRLAGLWRRNDEPTLAATNWCNQIDEPRGEILGIGFECDALVWEDGRK